MTASCRRRLKPFTTPKPPTCRSSSPSTKSTSPEPRSTESSRRSADQGLLAEDWGGDVVTVPVSAKQKTNHRSAAGNDPAGGGHEGSEGQSQTPRIRSRPRSQGGQGPRMLSLQSWSRTARFDSAIPWWPAPCTGACARSSMTVEPISTPQDHPFRSKSRVCRICPWPATFSRYSKMRPKRARLPNTGRPKIREQSLKKTARLSLQALYEQMREGAVKELPLIIKGDVQGSVEVVTDMLNKLSTEKAKVKILHSGAGAVTETDVLLASASNAIVIGFNVRPERKAQELADIRRSGDPALHRHLQPDERHQGCHDRHARDIRRRRNMSAGPKSATPSGSPNSDSLRDPTCWMA